MRLFNLLAATAVLCIISATAAFAQDTTVAVPYGDWLGEILGLIGATLATVIGGILAWALRFLPATLRAYITESMIKQAEQLLTRAVDHGLNTAAERLRGQTITVDVRHQVIADAVRYAIQHGPNKLLAWLGGPDAIREKIEARLPFKVNAADVVVPPGSTVTVSGS